MTVSESGPSAAGADSAMAMRMPVASPRRQTPVCMWFSSTSCALLMRCGPGTSISAGTLRQRPDVSVQPRRMTRPPSAAPISPAAKGCAKSMRDRLASACRTISPGGGHAAHGDRAPANVTVLPGPNARDLQTPSHRDVPLRERCPDPRRSSGDGEVAIQVTSAFVGPNGFAIIPATPIPRVW